MENSVVSYGFDRIKLSVSGRIKAGAIEHMEYRGSQHSFLWYADPQVGVGLSESYVVFEFYALWFINNASNMAEAWDTCLAYVDRVCERWENPRPSRIDVYIDRSGSIVKPLKVDMYNGKSKVKTEEFRGEKLESSYILAPNWKIRRYDKTKEIEDKGIGHRYTPEYRHGIIRTEAEYQKTYFKNLSDRSFENCIAYIVKNLKETTLPELQYLADRISEEVGQGLIVYKQSHAGERNGERLKQEIYRTLKVLHKDFVSVAGDDREFFAELAKLGKKGISIHT